MIINLDRLWFDFNYGGLAVNEYQLMNWSYEKIRLVYAWFLKQKEIEEAESKRVRNKSKT